MSNPEERSGLSAGARWAVILGAAMLLIVAFVALRGGSDGGSSDKASQPADTGTTATQQQTATDQSATEQQPTTQQQAAEPAAPAVATIRVKGGEPVGGVKRLSFHKGDRIRFVVVADAADEAHFHGYDIEKELVPGKRATFDAKATIEGRFEVELHHSGAKIAQVEVTP